MVLLLATAALAQVPDTAALLTRLGRDTLAVERWVRTAERMDAEVVLRSPTTTYARYQVTLQGGNVTGWRATLWSGADTSAAPVLREVATLVGDTLIVERVRGGQTQTVRTPADTLILPFIDMVHWPYELALMRMHRSGRTELVQPLLTGARPSPFTLVRAADGSVAITHPTRGTMTTRLDAQGRMLALDASGTTRALTVDRVRWLDVPGLGREFAARDAAGRSFGELSGRGAGEFVVYGVRVTLDYGTPQKRGREIWGALVPWGRVWRTGANRATHITTDGDLRFGDLLVPAGEYTLYSIPEPSGGVLIINRQTGQNGQTYNADRDLGRVPLRMASLSEPVEVFTIRVEDRGDGVALRLLWDRTEFYVPVRPAR
jgi:hypothetical protein